jgi:hypothetical protein
VSTERASARILPATSEGRRWALRSSGWSLDTPEAKTSFSTALPTGVVGGRA